MCYETPRSPANTCTGRLTQRGEEQKILRIANATPLTRKLIQEIRVLPPPSQQTAQALQMGKLSRHHSPQGATQALIPLTTCRVQDGKEKVLNITRKLSPQAAPSRQLLNIQKKKLPDISLDNIAAACQDTSSRKQVDISTSRSPREFKITTKRALDIPKTNQNSPRASNEELFDAVTNGDIVRIASLFDTSYFLLIVAPISIQ